MTDLTQIITRNLAAIRQRIDRAACRAGRTSGEVTLVAVTKYVDETTTRAAIAAGCRNLGESRPQHLIPKAEAIRDESVRWHMIGHLQRNKVRRVLPLVSLVESVDNVRLLEAIDRIADESDLPRVPVLLEVNISGDPNKNGFLPDALGPLLEKLPTYRHVDIRGLMGMAGLMGTAETARRDFARLRELRDRLVGEAPEGISFPELSMGMSGDFEEAIEEGATMVRIGSALFEGIL